jgi:predicted CoA-binding protein
MSFENPPVEVIRDILHSAKTIAVVGLSDNPARISHNVAQEMQRRGYRIIPVNPNATEILGERSFPSLKEVDVPVDIVNVFRRSEHTPPIAKEAVEIGAKVLWLQLGIINLEAYEIARQGGMTVIMDRCIKIEAAIHGIR